MGESISRKQSCLPMFPHLVLCWLFVVTSTSQGRDTLEAGQVLMDWEFLESPSKYFRLRFFGPDFTTNRYLGIQFGPLISISDTFVWIANRDRPLMDTSAVLNLTRDGILVLNYHGTSIAISSEQQRVNGLRNTTLMLLDSGNLVLIVGGEVIWQSFDHPTDTYIPGMKIGLFGLNGEQLRRQSLTSWTGPHAPGSGAFTLGVDPNNTKQLVIWRRGAIYWHSGTWNVTSMNFPYFPEVNNENRYEFTYTSNENESYFTLSMAREDLPSWLAMNSSGSFDVLIGDGGFMSTSSSLCNTRSQDMSMGCARVQPSICSKGDEFYLTAGHMSGWLGDGNHTLGISDCEEICRNSCSCNAYASQNADGTGCLISDGYKVKDSGANPDVFYIRKANTGVPLWVFVAVPLVSLTLFLSCTLVCYLLRRKFRSEGKEQSIGAHIDDLSGINLLEFSAGKDHELPFFSFSVVQSATNNFSLENKLGQGGFGPVYRGTFDDGQEVAVKRLSQNSGQGIDEFRNEVMLISKLQHRNLVRLLGCCILGEEKLLIYEYMPNKSLDSFLFDATRRFLLDWRKRFSIIEGIAQGLLYLHKYSRLRIIHRDIKTSNILLDAELNPKISDFGLARTFGDNESGGNTKNIAGTRGYMSPEYAMGGLFFCEIRCFQLWSNGLGDN